jgi:hypothetical protein
VIATLAAAIWQIPSLRTYDHDILRQLTWWAYGIEAVAYTVFVFWNDLRGEKPRLLYEENARPVSDVLLYHLLFLVFFLCFTLTCVRAIPLFPGWMTQPITLVRHDWTITDLIYLGAASGLIATERDWLYRERGKEGE